jgi:hypothetical protein
LQLQSAVAGVHGMDDFHQFVKAPRNLAACHSRSAEIIETKCRTIDASDSDSAELKAGMYISATLLRAFSIELSLKALHYCLCSKRATGHPLRKLFDDLPDIASKAAIKADFECIAGRPFDVVLDEISKVFVEWRYVHEKLASGTTLRFDTDEMARIVCAVSRELDRQISERITPPDTPDSETRNQGCSLRAAAASSAWSWESTRYQPVDLAAFAPPFELST